MDGITEIVERLKAAYNPNMPSSIPQYKCERCHDTGWVEVDPETRTVAKCDCRKAREAEDRLNNSGLKDALEQQTFDTFEVRTETQRHMKDTAQKYVTDLFADPQNKRRPWFYVGGNPGSGKTHICTAICGEMLNRNIAVRYMQWVDVARRLKASVNDEGFESMVSDYVDVSVLYIDDLLKQKYTPSPLFSEADIKIAFTILNARYLMNKPTIISSEWDLINHLLPADEGVFSRVYERCKAHRVMIGRDAANNYRLMA